jgi:methanogenic corrinoid protein MtbC1
MSSNGQFAAQILETSAAGYAGLTASLLIERNPGIEQRYEPEGFSAWKGQLQQWLLDLSAALSAGEPKLFEARMVWTRDAFAARQSTVEDLQAALAALREILEERLPGDSATLALPIIDRALEAVAEPSAGEAGAGAKPGKQALSYLETILEGKPREAVELLLQNVDGGMPVTQAYLDILIPAQQEAGRLWHAGALRIAEEHLISTTTRRAMTLLCERGRSSEQIGKTAVLGCVAGNVHDIGINALSDFFEMAGWHTINLGPDVLAGEFVRTAQLFDADIVLLSAVLDPHLKAIQQTVAGIRGLEDSKLKIIVGGPAFLSAPELWRKLGADGYAAGIDDAEPLASSLTEK